MCWAKLIIEIDGAIHDFEANRRHDDRRDAYLRTAGYTIIRLAARDVLSDLNASLEGLAAQLGH